MPKPVMNMMRKYTVRSVHKISNPCTCGHEHPDHGEAYSGRCKRYQCECTAYKPRDVTEHALPAGRAITGANLPDVKIVGKALRNAHLLPSGGRLASVTRDHGKLVCFPQGGIWHSIIIELAPCELTASVAILAEAKRVGWPTSFATDLAHDVNAVATMQPREPFTWCLRPDGTHVGRVVAFEERSLALKMHMVAKSFATVQCRFYVWDGAALLTATTAEAADTQLAMLARTRFLVKTRRSSSLLFGTVATKQAAESLAATWETRYGEDFITVDTWEAK